MFRDTFEHEFTWLNGFLRNVGRFAERPALHCPASGRRWTYRALNADANRLAHALTADGVGGNSVIMYMLLNSPEFAFCYLAGHKTGAVSCPVNYRLAPGELALIIDDSTPEIFVYEFRAGDYRPRAGIAHGGKLQGVGGGRFELCARRKARRGVSELSVYGERPVFQNPRFCGFGRAKGFPFKACEGRRRERRDRQQSEFCRIRDVHCRRLRFCIFDRKTARNANKFLARIWKCAGRRLRWKARFF